MTQYRIKLPLKLYLPLDVLSESTRKRLSSITDLCSRTKSRAFHPTRHVFCPTCLLPHDHVLYTCPILDDHVTTRHVLEAIQDHERLIGIQD